MNIRPAIRRIGIFDSGAGGLTVLRVLRQSFPGVRFTYLGDTARLPYGTKSAETIIRYTIQNAAFLLKKKVDLQVSPLGNPAMPMKLPVGPKWLRNINLPMPNAIPSLLPGFESAATAMMKKTFRDKGVASIEELRELSLEAGVKLVACQMTVDVFGLARDDFIEDVQFAGAATFLPEAQKADATMFI